MLEPPSDAAQQRRANWVGLRTLHQRPKLIDQTASGVPVYEVRSVRLVLLASSSHFSRLVECSRCGAEVPGGLILAAADLDRPSHSVICGDCVRSVDVASPSERPARGRAADQPAPPAEAATPQPPPAPEADETVHAPPAQEQSSEPVVVAPATGDGRLAEIEQHLQVDLLRVAEVADLQRSESSGRSEAEETVQAQVQSAVRESLAQLRAEVMASAHTGATRMAGLEDSLRRSVADVAQALEARKDELTGFTGALAGIRSDVEQLTEAVQRLGQAQTDLDRRVGELATQMSEQTTATALEEAERRIVESLRQARSHMTSLEEQLQRDVTSVTGMVESQRAELQRALDDRMRDELTTVATVVDETGLAQAQLARTVDELVRQVAATEAKLDALASSAAAGTERLNAVERGMQESVHRLTDDVRAQRRAAEASAAPAGGGPVAPADLLDALERQLQEAESRLARLGDL